MYQAKRFRIEQESMLIHHLDLGSPRLRKLCKSTIAKGRIQHTYRLQRTGWAGMELYITPAGSVASPAIHNAHSHSGGISARSARSAIIRFNAFVKPLEALVCDFTFSCNRAPDPASTKQV